MVERALRYQDEHNVSRSAACKAIAQGQKCTGASIFSWLKSHEAAKSLEFITTKALADDLKITSRTLRFYEEVEFVKPLRRGQTRLYTPEDRLTVLRVLRLRELGFSIAEIQRDGVDLDKNAVRMAEQEEKLRERQRDLSLRATRLEQALAKFEDE